MNIGDAQVAAMLAIGVFDEFFKALYAAGVIPAFSQQEVDTPIGRRHVTVLLQPPIFELGDPATNPRSLLHLLGQVELRRVGVSGGAPDATFPLDSWVHMDITLQQRPDDTPVGCIVYRGVDRPPAPPLTAEMIDDFFTSEEIQDILDDLRLELVLPIVESLEANLLPENEEPPPRSSWSADLRLLRAADSRWADALLVQVGLPGDDAGGGQDHSPLPHLTEFGIIYSRRLLNTALGVQAAEMESSETDGATITRLSLSMADTALLVDGQAERDNVVVTFTGPVRMSLIRGTHQFAVDSSDVDVDVDLPWWADLLLFLAGPVGGFFTFGLAPLIGSIVLATQGTSLGKLHRQLAAVPSLVRGSIGGALADGLAALAEGLRFETTVGETEPDSTPGHSRVENGHIAVFAQVFINPLTAAIVDGSYSRGLRRFVEFQIEGGRRLSAPELARLVKRGHIITPGYHAVEVRRSEDQVLRYMRANPDQDHSNNLLRLFAS
jgi:hypothetical protein